MAGTMRYMRRLKSVAGWVIAAFFVAAYGACLLYGLGALENPRKGMQILMLQRR